MAKKSTRISRFVEAVAQRPAYIGLVVRKKVWMVPLFEPEDGLFESYACPFDEGDLACFGIHDRLTAMAQVIRGNPGVRVGWQMIRYPQTVPLVRPTIARW